MTLTINCTTPIDSMVITNQGPSVTLWSDGFNSFSNIVQYIQLYIVSEFFKRCVNKLFLYKCMSHIMQSEVCQ